MAKIDDHYLDLNKKILANGFTYEDSKRKGVNRIQIPSYTICHSMEDGFPAITTKKLFWKGIVGELLWFLRGDTSPKYLIDNNINIWNKDGVNYLNSQTGDNMSVEEYTENVKKGYLHGSLGQIYGAQWRNFKGTNMYMEEIKGVDQIENLLKNLISNPMGTQHIVTAWNPAELENMALPPCHWSFEILVQALSKIESKEYPSEGKKDAPIYGFTLKWHQRSVDTFLGLPFNIASYALLAHIIAEITNMAPLAIIGDLSNVHLYEPHLPAVKEQMSRSTKLWNSTTNLVLSDKVKSLCALYSKGDISLDSLFIQMSIDDFNLTPYSTYPSLPATMLARD